MERKAMNDLIKWKNKKNRKPLMVVGARQVGKTWLLKEFGKRYFKNTIYVNLEDNTAIQKIFEPDLSPKRIIQELEIFYNEKIDKDNTLIIFDEIQNNNRALTSLKYFCEDERDYYIISSGSLLGVEIKKKDKNYSYPVGKVDYLTIYPLSFDEFLINTNNELLVREIEKSFENNEPLSDNLHSRALDLYNDYLALGGMPEVVENYIETNSMIESVDIQRQIIDGYRFDITKYSEQGEANKIIAAFDSIPNQLAKDNKKFQYKLVQKGGTSSIFGASIDWLVDAAIVNKCTKITIGIPLKMHEELESFKLYMNDVGLLTNLSNFPIYLIKNRDMVNEMMIGMLTENYVASSLKFNGLNLNYWQNDYESEVDFILQSTKGLIIPLEVKSNTHTKSRSLNNFVETYNPKYSIRVSAKNFGFKNGIKSVPLYAVFCLTKDYLDEVGVPKDIKN